MKKNAASTTVQGLFGAVEAFTASVEEQGRRTLPVHFQIWVKEIKEKREELFDEDRFVRRAAAKRLSKEADRTMSTTFITFADADGNTTIDQKYAFPHDCTKRLKHRTQPIIVDDQTLRELRYKAGNLLTGHRFAYCPDCTKTWTNEEMVRSYLQYGVKDTGFVATEGEGDFMRRMKMKALEYQLASGDTPMPTYVVEAGYNLHCHTCSCFKRTLKRSATKGLTRKEIRQLKNRVIECECRYRLPARKRRKTDIQDASEEKIKWYSWDGTLKERYVKELALQRNTYDLFQNQSCPAIGHSKFTCNTNLSVQFHGSTGQYSTKYCMKDTQADDREEFDRITMQKDRIIRRVSETNTDRSEATRRLLLGAFAHQRSNICGGPMSSFLTRNKERFIFSHETAWLPLRDIKALLGGNAASSSIVYSNPAPFFQCAALHFLNRPEELDACCAFDFYSRYEVVRITSKNADDLLSFHKTEHFQHPSFRKDRFMQGVRERSRPHLVKIFQYDFPDTAEFGGSILTGDVTEAMEKYSELVLLLFVPYRKYEDLTQRGSFTLKLRQCIGLLQQRHRDFLQNVQDSKSNSFRNTRLEDDLQRVTTSVHSSDYEEAYDALEEDGDDEETGLLHGTMLDDFLDLLNDSSNDTEETADVAFTTMDSLNLSSIKDKGRHNCGYSGLTDMHLPPEDQEDNFDLVTTVEEDTNAEATADGEDDNSVTDQRTNVCKGDLVRIIMERSSRVTRSFHDITGQDEEVDVLQANGSVKSIVDWARKATLDRGQRRAFEIITGAFLLTFYDDAEDSADRRTRHEFVRQKRDLQKLVEINRRKRQLIALLDGPGGSGKTTVIDLMMEYAREHYSYQDGMEFTSQTIVVTALTGVAATILRGETTHSACFLNQQRALEPEQIEKWEGTRLLIVDEISFASKKEFTELDKKLRRLKQRPGLPYGGLSVVFAGDFRQLEPIGDGVRPVYTESCPEFTEWVNCYLELNGMHRFRSDPAWGALLRRFREGKVTKEDIARINSRVVQSGTELPVDIAIGKLFRSGFGVELSRIINSESMRSLTPQSLGPLEWLRFVVSRVVGAI
jgi:hypothetical protein